MQEQVPDFVGPTAEPFIGPMPLPTKTFKDWRGYEYKFTAAVTNFDRFMLTSKRHGLTCIMVYREQEQLFWVYQKSTRQRKERIALRGNKNFDQAVKTTELAFNWYHKKECRDAELNAAKRSKNGVFLASLKPGVILCSTSYSRYMQDFYKIISVKGTKVTLIKVANQPVTLSEEVQTKMRLQHGGIYSWGQHYEPGTEEIGQPLEVFARAGSIKEPDAHSKNRVLKVWDGLPKHENR